MDLLFKLFQGLVLSVKVLAAVAFVATVAAVWLAFAHFG